MGEKSFFPPLGDSLPTVRTYFALVPIGAAGAIGTVDIPGGVVTVVKTAAKTGRYSFTLHRPFGRLLNVIPTMEGPADAAFGIVGGCQVGLRNMLASAGTFDVQAIKSSDGTDADVVSGNNIRLTIFVSDWKGL